MKMLCKHATLLINITWVSSIIVWYGFQIENLVLCFDIENIQESSTFEDLISSGSFIDKSLLIREFINCPVSKLFVTTPRSFCKSANMRMICKFLEVGVNKSTGASIDPRDTDGHRFFVNGRSISNKTLRICEDKVLMAEYFGKFPVIYVNFKDASGQKYSQVFQRLQFKLNALFKEFQYLLPPLETGVQQGNRAAVKDVRMFKKILNEPYRTDETIVDRSLELLCRLLCSYHKRKVYLFIDDPEVPIDSIPPTAGEAELNTVSALMASLLQNAVKNVDYVEKTLLTGTRTITLAETNPVAKLLSGFHEFKFLENHTFAKYYGFLEDEMRSLLTAYNGESGKSSVDNNDTMTMEELKNNCKGYPIQSAEDLVLYNPLSVLRAICLQSMWK